MCQTCDIRDASGRVLARNVGWVKVYVSRRQPMLPPHLSADGDIRWLNGDEGYYLVRCPDCATLAGKRQHREAA